MGFFTKSELTKFDEAINLLSQRLVEYAEFQEKTMHHTIASMLGALFDDVFKLYYPNKINFGPKPIKVATKQQGEWVAFHMPASYWVSVTFNMGLALEHDYKVSIFKDGTQRSFAQSIATDWQR